MIATVKLPWRDMLVEIHAKGVTWPGLGRELKMHERSVERYAIAGGSMAIRFERGMSILRLYQAFYPERFTERVKPLLAGRVDILSLEDALRQLVGP